MKRLLTLVLFTVAWWQNGHAQVLTPQRNDDGFFTDTETRINEQLRQNPDADKNFVIRSNFLLDRLLWSGQVIREDSLSRFSALVVKRLLGNDTALQKNIHVHTLRSSDVNAWTFDRGVILITTGLYARIQNEAQLAFVLAHEITHFKNKHALNTYALQTCDDVQRCSAPERLKRVNLYSRENEMEADREGIELMRSAGYNVKNVAPVFDMLQYSYLPVQEIKFRKNFLEDGALVFPSQYFLGLVNEIVRREEVNDTSSTHPSIRKRKVVTDLLHDSIVAGTVSFIVSDSVSFPVFQKTAGLALGNQLICEARYREAFYHVYTLLEKWPDIAPQAEIQISQALYGIALLRSTFNKGEDEVHNFSRYAGVQGEIQQVYYLFSRMGAMESAVLALNYNWKCRNKYPENNILKIQTENLIKILTGFYRMTEADFLMENPPAEQKQIDSGDDVRGEVYTPRPSYDFHKYALSGLFKNDGFRKAFSNPVSFYSTHSFIDEITSHDKPIPHLVLFDPFVRITDSKNPQQEFFYAEAENLMAYKIRLLFRGEADSIKVIIPEGFRYNPQNAFAGRTLLFSYMEERLLTGQLFFPGPAGIEALEELKKNKELKNTRYVLMCGIAAEQQFGNNDRQTTNPGKKGISGNPRTTYFTLLFDIYTGQLLLNERITNKKPLNKKQLDKRTDETWGKIRML